MRTWYQGTASNNLMIEERCKLFGFEGKRPSQHKWTPKKEAAPMRQCSTDPVKQGSIEAFAKTKTVWRPVPAKKPDGTLILNPDGTQKMWFNDMGLQNIVQITSYGKTFVFKKMQKASTIRDCRVGKGKSQTVEYVAAELIRLLGEKRAGVGLAFLLRITV